MELEEFKKECQKVGNVEFFIDATKYGVLTCNKCIYALLGNNLIGAYSESQKGVIFKKSPSCFSQKGREFTKIEI